jgi:hypothetical protein
MIAPVHATRAIAKWRVRILSKNAASCPLPWDDLCLEQETQEGLGRKGWGYRGVKESCVLPLECMNDATTVRERSLVCIGVSWTIKTNAPSPLAMGTSLNVVSVWLWLNA